MRIPRIVVASLVLLIASLSVWGGPAALPAPNLADHVFADGDPSLPIQSPRVIGFGPTGNIYVSGNFKTVDGQSRPDGIARFTFDGALDVAWSPDVRPTLEPGDTLKAVIAVESGAGAVAILIRGLFGNLDTEQQALLLVPPGSAVGVGIGPLDGPVWAMVFDEAESLYVARRRDATGSPAIIQKFSAAGALDTSFRVLLLGSYSFICLPGFPPVGPSISALAVKGAQLYVAGDFHHSSRDGVDTPAGGAARFATTTGELDATWHPMQLGIPTLPGQGSSQAKLTCLIPPTGAVTAMALAPDDKVYLSGSFERQSRKYLGRFSTTGEGLVDPTWNPDVANAQSIAAMALDSSAGHLYLGGMNVFRANGSDRSGPIALSTAPGAATILPWDPVVSGPVSRIALAPDRVLISGEFTVFGGPARSYLAGLPFASAPYTAAVIDFPERAFDFGKVRVGDTVMHSFVVNNVGNAPLVIQSVVYSTAPGNSIDNQCTAPIAPSASCTIVVTWTPLAMNSLPGTLTVYSNGSSVPQFVLVTGRTLTPEVTITGDGNFPPTPVGVTRARTVTIANAGILPAPIASISAFSGAFTIFTSSNDCPAVLLPGTMCTIYLTFTPLVAGAAVQAVGFTFGTPTVIVGSVNTNPVDSGSISLTGTGEAATADSDNDGIPNGVEITEGRNALVKDNDIFTGDRLFVMQQYRDFLGREGDAGGLTYWMLQLASGAITRGPLIDLFFGSAEFQGVGAPVARLYFATFLRIPDYAGLLFQMAALRGGTPLAVIANNFAASPEFQATYGALDNAQFVALLYTNILGRTAAQSEIDYHVNRIAAGATRGDVLVGFSESPEFQANTASDIFVTMIYVGMMRRAPEAGGFAFWTGYLDAGNSGLALIQGFLGGPEYRARFMP